MESGLRWLLQKTLQNVNDISRKLVTPRDTLRCLTHCRHVSHVGFIYPQTRLNDDTNKHAPQSLKPAAAFGPLIDESIK